MEIGRLHGLIPRRRDDLPRSLIAVGNVEFDETEIRCNDWPGLRLRLEQGLMEVGVASVRAPSEVRGSAYARRLLVGLHELADCFGFSSGALHVEMRTKQPVRCPQQIVGDIQAMVRLCRVRHRRSEPLTVSGFGYQPEIQSQLGSPWVYF